MRRYHSLPVVAAGIVFSLLLLAGVIPEEHKYIAAIALAIPTALTIRFIRGRMT